MHLKYQSKLVGLPGGSLGMPGEQLGGGLGVISAVILKDYKFLSPAIGTSIQVMIKGLQVFRMAPSHCRPDN